MSNTLVSDKWGAARAPGVDLAAWLRQVMALEATLHTGDRAAELIWEPGQPWSTPGQERRVGRAPNIEVVLIEDAAGPTALRVRRTAPPAFELTWRAGELTASVESPADRAEAVHRALRALAGAEQQPVATPPTQERAPEAPSRADLLRAVADCAREVGSQLSAWDHGMGGPEALTQLNSRLQTLLSALPAEDRAALLPLAAKGVEQEWTAIEAACRGRLAVSLDAETHRRAGRRTS